MGRMSNVENKTALTGESRRDPRLRVAVPFPCGFARVGPSRWSAQDKTGYGVVYDLSVSGARVMSPLAMSIGDTLAMSLRFPHQPAATSVDATVRWHHEQVFGLEFVALSRTAGLRLKKFLAQAGIFTALQA